MSISKFVLSEIVRILLARALDIEHLSLIGYNEINQIYRNQQ